jgi:glycerol-1-phosphate dehydrogenase [NAD(P)+]
MNSDPIALLLQGQYPDPETGEKLGVSVRSVVIEDRLDGRESELVDSLGVGRKLAVVSDPDTFKAMGQRVEKVLASEFQVQSVRLGPHPHPDQETLRKLLQAIASDTDAVIAVGSGSINDLCKMAAHERGCPQAIFGTAPSMNGYTSANAAITVGGLKKTLPATAPRGVFLDLTVMAAAPKRLIRSGLGDSLCRPTAQADWLLAHLLEIGDGKKYREAPFAMLAGDEGALFEGAEALLEGDLGVMRSLARTLVLSGFGMTICRGSYPASQGEHLISHYMDMMGKGLPESYHGEQIGVTTLAMARLQEKILAQGKAPVLKPSRATREQVVAHFGPELGESCWKELEPKLLDAQRAEALNDRLASRWDAIREGIGRVVARADRLEAVLKAAGAPTQASQLGWPEPLYADALAHSREIRNRYTFLDLAAELSG